MLMIETLESRRLLSISVATPSFVPVHSPVSTAPVSSTPTQQGVILHETAGVQFTASVGTFITNVPATDLHATIHWGDGKSSAGTLKSLGVIGLDEIKFEVDGTHTYLQPGDYPIRVLVTQPGPTPTSLVRIVARITSRAIVVLGQKNISLNGTISGTYSLAPTAALLGGGYVFNGTGDAGDMGAVSAHAFVTTPGMVAIGRATGTMTLTTIGASPLPGGTVTLELIGPPEAGFGPFPSMLLFVVTGGTGAFAGATGSGTIAVTLNSDMTFKFVLTSLVPTPV